MSGRLTGRVAIVTGAGRGLGRAMALGLVHAGARVVLTSARAWEELQAVTSEIRAMAGDDAAVALTADVTEDRDCARVVAAATERFGRVDVLVNNAGRGMRYVSERFMTEPTRFWETDPQTWKTVIDTNVNGPFLMARRAVPEMLRAGWGRVINISMNRETMRRRGFSPYGPSKAALESETVIWAQELEGTGVTVNSLLPGGATLTGMVPESFAAPETLLRPEVMVPPLLWLASAASDGVTGQRVVGSRWRAELPEAEAAAGALEPAGW